MLLEGEEVEEGIELVPMLFLDTFLIKLLLLSVDVSACELIFCMNACGSIPEAL